MIIDMSFSIREEVIYKVSESVCSKIGLFCGYTLNGCFVYTYSKMFGVFVVSTPFFVLTGNVRR